LSAHHHPKLPPRAPARCGRRAPAGPRWLGALSEQVRDRLFEARTGSRAGRGPRGIHRELRLRSRAPFLPAPDGGLQHGRDLELLGLLHVRAADGARACLLMISLQALHLRRISSASLRRSPSSCAASSPARIWMVPAGCSARRRAAATDPRAARRSAASRRTAPGPALPAPAQRLAHPQRKGGDERPPPLPEGDPPPAQVQERRVPRQRQFVRGQDLQGADEITRASAERHARSARAARRSVLAAPRKSHPAERVSPCRRTHRPVAATCTCTSIGAG